MQPGQMVQVLSIAIAIFLDKNHYYSMIKQMCPPHSVEVFTLDIQLVS